MNLFQLDEPCRVVAYGNLLAMVNMISSHNDDYKVVSCGEHQVTIEHTSLLHKSLVVFPAFHMNGHLLVTLMPLRYEGAYVSVFAAIMRCPCLVFSALEKRWIISHAAGSRPASHS